MDLASYVTSLGPRTAVLDNGLRVVVAEDHALPVVAVEVCYDVGSRDERPGRTGFAHLFEHLMFEGSASVAAGEHFRVLQSVGAVVNGTTSFDRTTYYQTVPAEHVELVLWLEADRMGGLLAALTQENLDNQRDVVKNERRQRMDNVPYGTAGERLSALLFPEGHPYHHRPIGSMADLDRATLDDCRAFFTTHYAPDNAVVALTGAITFDAAVDHVQRYFGHLAPAHRAPRPVPLPLGPLPEQVVQRVAEPVPAAMVATAFRLPADGAYGLEAAVVALNVLARGGGSRLSRRLVRERRLAASVTLDVVRLRGGVSFATVRVHGLPGVGTEELAGAVDAEIDALDAYPPSPDEVARAVALVERSWLDELAGVTTRGALLARYESAAGAASLAGAAARAVSVDEADVAAAVVGWLRAEHAAVVAYEVAS